MSGACFRRWGVVHEDETPRLSTSHTGTAILNLPVPLGVQPGHLRRPSPGSGTHCAADARRMQTPTAHVGRSRVSVEDRRRPLLSAEDRST